MCEAIPKSPKGSPGKDLWCWKSLWSSRFAGFIQAAMYKDNWRDNIDQDFELKFGSSS